MPDESTPLPAWTAGQPISAQRLNDVQQRVDSVRMIRGGAGVTVAQGRDGVVVGLADPGAGRQQAFNIVINSPVSTNAAGFYNGTIQLPTSTAAATAQLSLPQNMSDGRPCIVMNAAENNAVASGVSDDTYAVGVLAGISGTNNTPLVMTYIPVTLVRVTLTQDWQPLATTITATAAGGGTQTLTCDLLFNPGTNTVAWCNLRASASASVIPYPAGWSMGSFGLVVGWQQVPSAGSSGTVLQLNPDGTASFGPVKALA